MFRRLSIISVYTRRMIQAVRPKAWLKERKTWHMKVISESIVDDGSLDQII